MVQLPDPYVRGRHASATAIRQLCFLSNINFNHQFYLFSYSRLFVIAMYALLDGKVPPCRDSVHTRPCTARDECGESHIMRSDSSVRCGLTDEHSFFLASFIVMDSEACTQIDSFSGAFNLGCVVTWHLALTGVYRSILTHRSRSTCFKSALRYT